MHRPFDGTERHWVQQMGPDTPFYANLIEDERFWSVAAQLYGEDTFAVGCDANRYVGDSRWHPNHHVDPKEDCYGVKFVFYLDPVGPDSGALRLVLGSHKNPLHGDLRENIPAMDLALQDIPAYICTSQPGDVVAFDIRSWHANFGGTEGRRMSTCAYYKNPEPPEEEQAARKHAANSHNPRPNTSAPAIRSSTRTGSPTTRIAPCASPGSNVWTSWVFCTRRSDGCLIADSATRWPRLQ